MWCEGKWIDGTLNAQTDGRCERKRKKLKSYSIEIYENKKKNGKRKIWKNWKWKMKILIKLFCFCFSWRKIEINVFANFLIFGWKEFSFAMWGCCWGIKYAGCLEQGEEGKGSVSVFAQNLNGEKWGKFSCGTARLEYISAKKTPLYYPDFNIHWIRPRNNLTFNRKR